MKTVLGLSLTQSRVGWILVDAQVPEGSSLDDDAFEVTGVDAVTARAVAAAHSAETIAAASGHEIRSIGVAWCGEVAEQAAEVVSLLRDAGYVDVRAVAPEALEDSDAADCHRLDPLELAFRAADAVVTDAVPKVRACTELCRSGSRSTMVKLVAAAVGVTALLGGGAAFLVRDAQAVPDQTANAAVGVPEIVSAGVPLLVQTHRPAAVSPVAVAAEPTYRYAAPEPVQTHAPQASIAAQAPSPASSLLESDPMIPAAPVAASHLPASATPGLLAPGPVPVAQVVPVPVAAVPVEAPTPVAAQPAAQPVAAQPAAAQPAAAQPFVPIDPLAGLMSALP